MALITGSSGTIKFNDGDSSNYFTLAANATTTADTAYTWPAAAPGTSGFALTATTGGVMSWAAAGGGDFTNGGDAGALILGTNDSNSLTLETNNTARMVIAAGGDVSIVGGAKFILDGAGGNTYFTDDTDTVELYVGGTHAQRWDKGGAGIYELHYNIQSQFSDGTASAPGICFRGGTPSGFYRPNVSGEYSIGFVANGTERMRLTHAGKVGIGTTSPDELLTVNGGVRAQNTVGAWVNTDWVSGTGAMTLTSGSFYNVSAATDNGTGLFTLSWDVDFVSANTYACGGISQEGRLTCQVSNTAQAVGSCQFATFVTDSGSRTDSDPVVAWAIGKNFS